MGIVLCLASPAIATTISGAATVIDGDTLQIAGKRIRLFAIDAPEAKQSCQSDGQKWACGLAAANRRRSLIGEGAPSCNGDEVDQYGRLVAVCTLMGVDLGQAMVADGWAAAFRRYSDQYVADETRARAGKLGLWASSFELPEDYRAAQREMAGPSPRAVRTRVTAQTPSSACLFKGKHSRGGEWIYHLPGMPYYERTRAEEEFCTEAEAQAAGYRRSRAH